MSPTPCLAPAAPPPLVPKPELEPEFLVPTPPAPTVLHSPLPAKLQVPPPPPPVPPLPPNRPEGQSSSLDKRLRSTSPTSSFVFARRLGKSNKKATYDTECAGNVCGSEGAHEARGPMRECGVDWPDAHKFSDVKLSQQLRDFAGQHRLGPKMFEWLLQRPKSVLAQVLHRYKFNWSATDNAVMKFANDITAWLWDRGPEKLLDDFSKRHLLEEATIQCLQKASQMTALKIIQGSWYQDVNDSIVEAVALMEHGNVPRKNQGLAVSGRRSPDPRARRTPTPLRGRPSSDEEASKSSDNGSVCSKSSYGFRKRVGQKRGTREVVNDSGGNIGRLTHCGARFGFVRCDPLNKDFYVNYEENPDVRGRPVGTLVEFSVSEKWDSSGNHAVACDVVEFDLASFFYAHHVKAAVAQAMRVMTPAHQCNILQACRQTPMKAKLSLFILKSIKQIKSDVKNSVLPPPPPVRTRGSESSSAPLSIATPKASSRTLQGKNTTSATAASAQAPSSDLEESLRQRLQKDLSKASRLKLRKVGKTALTFLSKKKKFVSLKLPIRRKFETCAWSSDAVRAFGSRNTEDENVAKPGECSEDPLRAQSAPSPEPPVLPALPPSEKHTGTVVEIRGLRNIDLIQDSIAFLEDLLCRTLEELPSYHKEDGPAVLRIWDTESGFTQVALQNEVLCQSSIRVLNGLKMRNWSIEAVAI